MQRKCALGAQRDSCAGAPKRLVLVVDDDITLLNTLVDQLAEEGEFTAIPAASIQEAEAKLARENARFDTIILDVGLPDGY